MFEAIKTTEKLEFDLIYADGVREHVSEGVLLGIRENEVIFHLGTSRASVLFAALDCLLRAIANMGLTDLAVAYLSADMPDEEADS